MTERVEREHILEEFAYVASHDLQEPLRIMTSYLKLLKEEISESLGTDATKYLDTINNSASKMQKLIEGILKFSQARMSPLDVQPVKLKPLIKQVSDGFSTTLKEIGASIGCQTDVTLSIHSGSFLSLIHI